MIPAELYAANVSKFSGAPQNYSPGLEHYARRMGKPVPVGTEWTAFTAQIDAEDKELAAANDLTCPLWLPDDKHGWCGVDCPEGSREALRRACSVAWGEAPCVLAAYRVMATHAPQWMPMPADVSDRNEVDTFVFARARCFFSGAGYANWHALARILCSLFPSCPFDPNQSLDDWTTDLHTAHKTCGWPVTLGWADYRLVPEVDNFHDWMTCIGWMHVVKHARREEGKLVVAYRGHIDAIDSPRTGSMCPAQWKNQLPAILQALGAMGKGGKRDAVMHCLARLRLDDFSERKNLGLLPGTILRGDWSTVIPAARLSTSFIRHDLRLDGVWEARGGKIRTVEGDDDDIMDWAWNLDDARSSRCGRLRERFTDMLPSSYKEGSPAAMLTEWFPHWVVPPAATLEREAYFALLDAVLCASVVRKMVTALDSEFPLVLIMPDDPTAEGSTNQGKGLLTRAMTTGMVGDIPRPKTAPDSGSAPDSRSIAAVIRAWGTIGLDEFQIPATKSHILSRDNLQSLCTGGEVTSGLAHENGDGNVALSHSIVINSKCLDLAPDLMNRSLPLFLGPCSDAQRARVDVKRLIETGAVGLRLRLAAIGCAEVHYLAEACEDDLHLPAATGSWRFTSHRAMAAKLLVARTKMPVDTVCEALDRIAGDMNDALRQHQLAADASGLSSSTETGKNIRLPWPAVWEGVSEDSVDLICAAIGLEGKTFHDTKMVNASELLRLRLDHTGQPGRMLSTILSYASGSNMRVSNIAVARAASDGLKSFYGDAIQDSAQRKELVWSPMPGDLGLTYDVAVAYRGFSAATPADRTLMVSIKKRNPRG